MLSSIYGYVEAGEILALMGPSRCGKSTMSNALAHRLVSSSMKVSGSVRINVQSTTASKLSYIARYVEQEDALIGSLTVRKSVEFSARLALPTTIKKTERLRRVNILCTPSAFKIKPIR